MIKAGEASGKLDGFLVKLVEVLEKREKIKSSIKAALFYPIILFVISMSVMILMLVKVVPIFVEMYSNMNVELPGSTKMILGVSAFVRGKGGLFTLIIMISLYSLHKFTMRKNYNYRKFFHRFFLKMPLFGNLILKSILARKALIMGNLAAAGVNLLENIDIAATVTDNVIIRESMENIKRGVFSGTDLSTLYRKETIFPLTFAQLIKVGEKTGNIEEIYSSIAKYYEDDFDNAVAALSKTIEPIMIVFMGVIIGVLLLALYSPIFNVGSIIGG
jgi:type IV pilus assembly protein PilC